MDFSPAVRVLVRCRILKFNRQRIQLLVRRVDVRDLKGETTCGLSKRLDELVIDSDFVLHDTG